MFSLYGRLAPVQNQHGKCAKVEESSSCNGVQSAEKKKDPRRSCSQAPTFKQAPTPDEKSAVVPL